MLGLQEADDGLKPIDSGGLAMRWRNKPLSEIDTDTVFRLIEEVRHKGVPGIERRNKESSEPRAGAMHAVLSKMFNWRREAPHRRQSDDGAEAAVPAQGARPGLERFQK